jgi:hypothetical protein
MWLFFQGIKKRLVNGKVMDGNYNRKFLPSPMIDLPAVTPFVIEEVSSFSLSLRATGGSVAISILHTPYEIASVVQLPRNDMTKSLG